MLGNWPMIVIAAGLGIGIVIIILVTLFKFWQRNDAI